MDQQHQQQNKLTLYNLDTGTISNNQIVQFHLLYHTKDLKCRRKIFDGTKNGGQYSFTDGCVERSQWFVVCWRLMTFHGVWIKKAEEEFGMIISNKQTGGGKGEDGNSGDGDGRDGYKWCSDEDRCLGLYRVSDEWILRFWRWLTK